jgi:hypothetical protein
MMKTNLLRDLLKAKEPMFSLSVRELEELTGKNYAYKELILEIEQNFKLKLGQLGLDVYASDEDIYLALLGRIKDDNQRLAKILGIKNPDSPEEVEEVILHIVKNITIEKDAWVINENTAKKMMLANPPLKAMQVLGHKDAKTLAEKEDIYELFGIIRFSEGEDWLNKFNEGYLKLVPADFERRPIKFRRLSRKWLNKSEKFVEKKKHNLTHSKEMGVVYYLPVLDDIPGALLRILPLTFHYINEIRMYSAFFKLIRRRSDFAQKIVKTLIAEPEIVKFSDLGVNWGVIQRYFGKLKNEKHPEEFLPHLQPEDLHWRKAEEVIYQLDPEFKFWQDMDWVAKVASDGEPLTLNLMDVSLSFSNKLKFNDRLYYHFRESLWDQLFIKYFGYKQVEELLIEHIDNETIDVRRI